MGAMTDNLVTRLGARIRSAAAEAIGRYHVPGIAVAVLRGQEVVFEEAFGYADIEAKEPMDGGRQHCIASVTKTMVGLCAMALVDEGKLSLDAKVQTLLPDVRFDGPAETMTLWHLLTHTAGIGEAQTPELLADTVNPDADARRKAGDFASMYKRGIVIEAVPGVKWHYANHGYNLLGEIISRAEDGADLQHVLMSRIFSPLGMHNSNLLGQADPRLTAPYHRAPNEDTREQLTRAGIPIKEEVTVDGHNIRGRFGGEFNKAALASGGVQSTLPDMSKYAAALLRRADGIVRRETFDAMISPQYCPDDRFTNWGLSFQRTPFNGRTLIGHGGAYFGGWNSHVDVSLDENVAIVQHMNMMHPEPADIFDMVRRAVFDVSLPEPVLLATSREALEQAPGLYELTPGRLTNFRPATGIGRVRIERDGDHLTLTSRWGDWKRGVELVPADRSDTLYFAIAREAEVPKHVVFTRDAAGLIHGLRCERLVHMVKTSRS